MSPPRGCGLNPFPAIGGPTTVTSGTGCAIAFGADDLDALRTALGVAA